MPCRTVLPPTRCALTAPFHPYQRCCQHFGGLLSVALSVGSRPPGVTWHPARRARTFLHPRPSDGARAATAWPALRGGTLRITGAERQRLTVGFGARHARQLRGDGSGPGPRQIL